MNFLELARKRYSVRSYTEEKVDRESLDLILEAGRVAPTAANRQPQHLIVVQEKEGLNKLSKAANIHGAPLAIIICSDGKQAWTRAYDQKQTTDIDASIVTDHMMLQAADLGLGSLWICHFDPEKLRQEFSLPGNIEPINILTIGHANLNEEPARSPDRHDKLRKPLSETVFYEAF